MVFVAATLFFGLDLTGDWCCFFYKSAVANPVQSLKTE
jgi:hypothetical protein